MGLYVRNVDVARLASALDVCLAPFAFESCDAWRSAVERETRELLQGDHAVFAIPRDGRVDVHATNVAPAAVESMGRLFAGVPDIPADTALNAVEAARGERGLEVWSRVPMYLDAVQGGLAAAALRSRWGLTAREAEIAIRLDRRATNTEMAAELGVSPHTIRHHVERVFLKLAVHSRRQVSDRLAELHA